MSERVQYVLNKASEAEIAEFLFGCDGDFVPPLSGRVNVNAYAQKIAAKALRFEAWASGRLIGMVAIYCDDPNKGIAFITSVSLLREWTGKGIASRLIRQCIERARELGFRQVSLEVAEGNTTAIRLYQKNGFIPAEAKASFVRMNLFW